MALRADSYGSVAEVTAFTKHILDGQSAFNSTTRPTLTEVEKFIDRSSSYVNVALRTNGFAAPVTNSTAVLMLDDWVVDKASLLTELTQRGAGFSEADVSRTASFRAIADDAMEFISDNVLGLKRLGLTVSEKLSDGLAFTALDDQDRRADPDDSTLEQPMFTRGLFNSTNNDAGSG